MAVGKIAHGHFYVRCLADRAGGGICDFGMGWPTQLTPTLEGCASHPWRGGYSPFLPFDFSD
jgi:hypothetical protein